MSKPTTVPSLDSKIHAFAEIGKLERRVNEIDDIVGVVKRKCLDASMELLPMLVTATSDLRWHLKQVATHIFYIEQHLGITGRSMPDVSSESSATISKLPTSGLRGTTDTIALSDLLNLLSTLRKTGSLSVRAGETIYVLEFLEGAIVHAVTNQRRPEWRLGTILEAQCKLTAEQLQSNLDAVERTKELLGDRLVRTECVSEGDLRAALEMQVRNLFESLFAIKFARFTFVAGGISSMGQRVCLSTTQLLVENARRQDESRSAKPLPLDDLDGSPKPSAAPTQPAPDAE